MIKPVNKGVIDTTRRIERGGRIRENMPETAYRKSKLSGFIFISALYIFAAFLYSEYYAEDASITLFSDANLNTLLFGPDYSTITNIPAADKSIALAARAGLLMFLTGIIPYCTYLYQKSFQTQTASPYKSVWVMSGVLLLTAFLFDSILWSLILDVKSIFF